jgi:uncharacterized protein (TIGR02444 family)
LTSALWDFALQIYGRPEVEAVLMELQDGCGQSVGFLIWALWLAKIGRASDEAGYRKAAALADAWESKVTAPLREVRRGLKRDLGSASAAAADFREQVKALELQSERILLTMLESSASDLAAVDTPPRELLQRAALAWGAEAPAFLLDRLVSVTN